MTTSAGAQRDAESQKNEARPAGLHRLFDRGKKDNQRAEGEPDPYDTITQSLDEAPAGYPQLATLLSSDHNYMQYRGFSYLHARLLLYMQYDIERLEEELKNIDKQTQQEDAEKQTTRLSCRARDDIDNPKPQDEGDAQSGAAAKRTRFHIFRDLKRQLWEYDKFLLQAKQMSSLQRPAEGDWRCLCDWFHKSRSLVAQEQEYIKKREDIITFRKGREGLEESIEAVFRGIEAFFDFCHWKDNIIKRIFKTEELRNKTSLKEVLYYDSDRMDTAINLVIAIIIFVLLVLPIVTMYQMTVVKQGSPFAAIGLLMLFTLTFGAAMSTLTKATRQELFAASAAYCAVLVVFVSNFSAQTVELDDGQFSRIIANVSGG